MSGTDWSAVGDLVCEVLHLSLGEGRARLEREAKKRGISFEQLLAAALTGAVREQVEGCESAPPR